MGARTERLLHAANLRDTVLLELLLHKDKHVKWVNQRRMSGGWGRGRYAGHWMGPGMAILVAYSWFTFGNGGSLSRENPLWRVMGEDEYFGGREWTQKGLSGQLMYSEQAAGATLRAQRSIGQEIS